MGLVAGDGSDVTGIVLAAGAGLRAGGPKALRRMPDGTPWLASAVAALQPCRRIIVVLGAGAEDARPLVPEGVEVVVAADWESGMSASLAAGLRAAIGRAPSVDLPGANTAKAATAEAATAEAATAEAATAKAATAKAATAKAATAKVATANAALVTLVDLPGLPPTVARRLFEGGVSSASLKRAVFGGRPGHPVLIGADHWPALVNNSGSEGARQYLTAHGAAEIECGDLADGLDDDGPA